MIREYLRFRPVPAGREAPALSLTADEGTWIKLRDFQGHLHVIFWFFKNLDDAETRAYLQELNAARVAFEGMDTAVFGVSHHKPEALRALRDDLKLDFYLIYDPFALTARTFGASGRVRPYCKDTLFLVGKDQVVAWSERGRPAVQPILRLVAGLQGTTAPELASFTSSTGATQAPAEEGGENHVVDVDPDTAVKMLSEKNSPYLLVDVRSKAEFEADRAPSAIHIPVDEITHRYHDLGQEESLIFICQSGGRSATAAEFMVSIGKSEIYNVVGGMSAWTGERTSGAVK